MALHEQSVGNSDEWYTPAYVFYALGVAFDMDVSAPPGGAPFVPASSYLTKADDGLTADWRGFVWMNPPFGGRNGITPWLDRFFTHGNGIALTPDRTSAPWWQDYAKKAEALLFVRKKIRFFRPDLTEGKSPAQGTTLMALGVTAVDALKRAEATGLGLVVRPNTIERIAA